MASKNCWHYRCADKKCYARRSLLHPISWYRKLPRCKVCKSKWHDEKPLINRWWYDKTYAPRRAAAECRCDAMHFPHRLGAIINGLACHSADPQRASSVKGWWPAADGIGTWVGGEHVPF